MGGGKSGYDLGYDSSQLSKQAKNLSNTFNKDYGLSSQTKQTQSRRTASVSDRQSNATDKTSFFSLDPVYKKIFSSIAGIPKQTASVISSILSPVGDFVSGLFINENVSEVAELSPVKKSSSSVIPAQAGIQAVSNKFDNPQLTNSTSSNANLDSRLSGNDRTVTTNSVASTISRREVETLIKQSDDRNLALIRSILVAPSPLTNSDSLSVQQSLDNLSRRISVIQENNVRQLDKPASIVSRTDSDISTLTNVTITGSTITSSTFSGTTGTFSGLLTGADGTFSGDLTVSSELTVSGTGTSTFSGRLLATKVPTLAHTFSVWDTDTANSNVLDSSILINPSSATADSNLFGIAVNDNVKFLVDAEGDVFVRNLTATGTVNQANTSISTLTVENTATFGDAVGDSITINAGTITSVNPIAWNLPNSQTSALNFESGLFNLDTSNSRVGIGTTSPGTILSVSGVGNFGGTGSTLYSTLTTPYFTATSTTASTFPYASSTSLTVSGSTYLTNLGQGWLHTAGGTNALTSSTSPTVAYITATSTTATSTFNGDINFGITSNLLQGGQRFLTSSATVAGNLTIGYQSATGLDANGGLYNTGVGYQALGNATSTDYNTALGYQALKGSATIPSIGYNTAVGYQALFSNITGVQNTANGYNSLYTNTTGSYNTANGFQSLRSNTTGAGNVGFGFRSGYGDSTTEDQRSVIDNYATFIGYQASRSESVASTSALTNITAIGKNARVGASNSIVLGGTGADAVNVGIGTTSPYARLSVVGETVAEKFTATSTTATSTFAGGMNIAGSSGLTVLQNGNVGVGTTLPQYKLSIDGNAGSTNGLTIENLGTATRGIDLSNSGLGSGDYLIYISGTQYWGADGKFNTYWVRSTFVDTDNLRNTDGATKITIGSNVDIGSGKLFVNMTSGLVGIGTTSPYSKLSVWGAGTGANRLFELTNSASTTLASFQENGTGYFLGNLGIGTTSPYAKLSVVGETVAEKFTATSTTATSTFAGGMNVAGTAGLTVLQNGNVGVGTTPRTGYKLDVSGIVSGTTLEFGGDNDVQIAQTIDSMMDLKGQAGFIFKTFPNSSWDEMLRINVNGNLGIGTTSPYAKLSVVGETVAEKFTATSTTATSTFAGGVTLATGGGSVGIGCSNPDHIFEIGGTGTGCNTGAGSYLNAAGDLAFTANSSREWKENITTYGKADILSRIKNTPVRTFDWKPEYCPSGNCLDKLGFIAEEFYGVLGRGDDKHVNGQDVTMSLWLGMQNFINVFDITSSATGTPALVIDALGNWKIGNDGTLTVKEVRTDKLCVGSVCVTEEQFRSVFGQPAQAGSPAEASTSSAQAGGSSSPASASSQSSQTSSVNSSSSSSSSSAFSSLSSSAQTQENSSSSSVSSSSAESSASSSESSSFSSDEPTSDVGSSESSSSSASSVSSEAVSSSSSEASSETNSSSSSEASPSESSSSTSSLSDSSASSSSSVAETSSSSSESASS